MSSDTSRDPSSSSVIKVGDKLFNIPSPLETAMLIEEAGGHFSEDMLNPSTDPNQFNTTLSRAINLGIYGADLGYALIHNQSQKAFHLLATTKKLSSELGISPGLYAGMMKRFEGNMENRDSLLMMISELNQLSDEYLKENENEDISALILYGGWIESLYFLTTLNQQNPNEKLRQRIGEQKNTLENLIGLLSQVNGDGKLDDLIAKLNELKSLYDKVNYQYEWVEPETFPDKHLTVIKSKSSIDMSDEVLAEITSKVSSIRNELISTNI
ncbi:MAG: hypothetical protein Kow0075_04300 [Salibacteraceae bacterium]